MKITNEKLKETLNKFKNDYLNNYIEPYLSSFPDSIMIRYQDEYNILIRQDMYYLLKNEDITTESGLDFGKPIGLKEIGKAFVFTEGFGREKIFDEKFDDNYYKCFGLCPDDMSTLQNALVLYNESHEDDALIVFDSLYSDTIFMFIVLKYLELTCSKYSNEDNSWAYRAGVKFNTLDTRDLYFRMLSSASIVKLTSQGKDSITSKQFLTFLTLIIDSITQGGN